MICIYMDIIQVRQERRLNQITEITESIKSAYEKDKGIRKKDIVMAVMSNIGVSKRTAQEYIEIALFNLGLKLDA